MNFTRLNPADANQLLATEHPIVLDVRDFESFNAGHLPGAQHIEQIDIDSFVEQYDQQRALLIYCYHGHSSQSAAAYFQQRGIQNVISMDGGYEQWRHEGLPSEQPDIAG